MRRPITHRLQEIDLLLTNQYNIAAQGEFNLAQNFGLDVSKKVLGLRIPFEQELNASSFIGASGAVLLTYANLSKMCITLVDSKTKDEIISNLPLTALVIDSNEIHAGPYYQINMPVEWSESRINVVSPLAALAAGSYYALSIQVIFED